MKKRYLALAVLLITISVVLAGISLLSSIQGNFTGLITATAVANTGLPEEKTIELENATAFDLLDKAFELEYEEYEGMGRFITSVQGVGQNNTHYWIFFINEEPAQVGVDNYIVQDNDKIEMRIIPSDEAMQLFK